MARNIIISNSPVEFVIIGPLGGRDRVLVRSADCGTDLIGFGSNFGDDTVKSTTDLISLVAGRPPINAVTSDPMQDIMPILDSRTSRFRLVWRGFGGSNNISVIHKTFKGAILQAYNALRGGDENDVEWIFAPLIYELSKQNRRLLRLRLFLVAGALFYLTVFLFALLIAIQFVGKRGISSIEEGPHPSFQLAVPYSLSSRAMRGTG
jgi:hypothetical protein